MLDESLDNMKRGIAGTMIFILFDRHPLLNPEGLGNRRVQLDIDEIVPGFAGEDMDINLSFTSNSDVLAGSPIQEQESSLGSANSDQTIAQMPWYVDQIPPFDVTLVGANEYGAMMKMAIAGCEILNEGTGVSIDDIVTEHEFTYVARGVVPWTAINNPDQQFVGEPFPVT